MKSKVAAAALQYSKKLSQEITWFWIVYRFVAAILATIQPTIAPSLAQTIAGVDTIMMINVGTYLVNSLGEKYLYSDQFVLQWINKGGWRSLAAKLTNLTVDDDDEEKNG